VKSVVTRDGEMARAFPPISVTDCLEDKLDISRGKGEKIEGAESAGVFEAECGSKRPAACAGPA